MKAANMDKVAKAIKKNRVIGIRGQYDEFLTDLFIEDLCGILAADNKKFDKKKFLELLK